MIPGTDMSGPRSIKPRSKYNNTYNAICAKQTAAWNTTNTPAHATTQKEADAERWLEAVAQERNNVRRASSRAATVETTTRKQTCTHCRASKAQCGRDRQNGPPFLFATPARSDTPAQTQAQSHGDVRNAKFLSTSLFLDSKVPFFGVFRVVSLERTRCKVKSENTPKKKRKCCSISLDLFLPRLVIDTQPVSLTMFPETVQGCRKFLHQGSRRRCSQHQSWVVHRDDLTSSLFIWTGRPKMNRFSTSPADQKSNFLNCEQHTNRPSF